VKKGNFIRALTLALAFNAAAAGPVIAQRQRAETQPDRYAAIVIEEKSGKVLYERDANQVLHPASTTKLMTSYLVFKALKEGRLTLDQELSVSHFAASQPSTNLLMMQDVPVKSSKIGKNGKKITVTHYEKRQSIRKITVENALKGMLCRSANDAAVVFAEALGGSQAEFAKQMNEEAKRLGMTHTTYVNPNGLPNPRQNTTVEDMTKLATALIEDFPEYYSFFSIRSFTYNGHTFSNTNRMLGVYPGLDGMKTGWIASSGFNLVASAVNNDQRVIGVVFGANLAEARNEDMRRLLDFAFNKLKNPKIRFTYGPESARNTPERYVQLPPKTLEIPPAALVEKAPESPAIAPESPPNAPKVDIDLPAVAAPQKMYRPKVSSRAPS
jgi:D-alanyl-D-alanine carboxypeptidase